MQSIQHALDNFTPSDSDPKAVVKRANWLLNELDQEAISTEDQVALTTILTSNHTQQAKMDLQKAIKHLRDDHTSVANDLLDLKIRISKLEDNVRALTAQRNSAQDSPRMAQEIEAITRYGRTVVLKIPKGQALVPLRASRSLTPTPPNHRADSAPNSQISEDDMVVDGADQPTSSQSTPEIGTQPEVSKPQNLEKVSFITHVDCKSQLTKSFCSHCLLFRLPLHTQRTRTSSQSRSEPLGSLAIPSHLQLRLKTTSTPPLHPGAYLPSVPFLRSRSHPTPRVLVGSQLHFRNPRARRRNGQILQSSRTARPAQVVTMQGTSRTTQRLCSPTTTAPRLLPAAVTPLFAQRHMSRGSRNPRVHLPFEMLPTRQQHRAPLSPTRLRSPHVHATRPPTTSACLETFFVTTTRTMDNDRRHSSQQHRRAPRLRLHLRPHPHLSQLGCSPPLTP